MRRIKINTAITILMVLVAIFALIGAKNTAPAASTLVLDQAYDPGTTGLSQSIRSMGPMGQEFTPSISTLARVDVDIGEAGGASGLVTMKVREGTIHGEVIATRTESVAAGFSGWVIFDIPDVGVIPGEVYVIELQEMYVTELQAAGPGDFNPVWHSNEVPWVNNPYPRGRAITYGTPVDNNDYHFRTWGIEPTPTPTYTPTGTPTSTPTGTPTSTSTATPTSTSTPTSTPTNTPTATPTSTPTPTPTPTLPPDFAFIKIWFMTPEGEPYPFDITISDGEWKKGWYDVTYIETEVPSVATYMTFYERTGYQVRNQFELPLSPGEVKEFEFYAIDLTEVDPMVEPLIIFQEKGANASISWEWDPDEYVLAYDLTHQPGTMVDVGFAIDDNTQEPPNYALTWTNVDIDTHFEGHVPILCWDFEIDDHIHFELSSGEIEFSEIDPNEGTIGIGNAFHNDAIIQPIELRARAYDGLAWGEPEFITPQYAFPTGYYILLTTLPEEYASLEMPLQVAAGKGLRFNLYPPRIPNLESYTFSEYAEYFSARSSYTNLTHDEEANTLSVDVSTETAYDWWGSFVLPDSHQVKSILACAEGACIELSELTDYTVNRVEGHNIVVVRIEPTIDQLSLTYEYRIYLPLIMRNYPTLIQLKP